MLFGCAWRIIEQVMATVAFGLAHHNLTDVTHIDIDEILGKKGHVCVTNVYTT